MTEEVVGGSTILIGGDAEGFVAAIGSAIQAAERGEKVITSKVANIVQSLAGVDISNIGKLAKQDKQALVDFGNEVARSLSPEQLYKFQLAAKGVNEVLANQLVATMTKLRGEAAQLQNVELFKGFEKNLAAASSLGEVEKRINALTTSMERLTGEERKAAEQALQLARAQEQASRTKTDNDNYVAALAKRTNAIGKSFAQLQLEEVALLKQEAAMRGVSAQAAPYIAKIEAAALATQKMGVSAGQTRQALAQLPAQFTDVFTSLAGGINPLLVLVQQGGQIKDSFGGIGNALKGIADIITPARIGLGLIAGAVVALGLAYKQGSAEQDAYAKGLILTGGAAGASVGQINEMAKAISASVGTQGKAAEVLAQLAASGTVSASVMQRAADAAIRMERAGGQAAAETAKQIAELGKDPVAAVLKLNDGLNFLTRSTFDQIKALQDVGATTQAAKVAQEAYADAVLQRSAALEARLGTFEKAWRSLGDVAKSAWDKMLNIGRPKTLEETVAEAEAAVLRAQERLAGRGTRRGGSVAELSGAPARAASDLEDAKAYRDTQREALKIRDKLVEKAAAEAALSQKIGEASKLTEAALGSQAKYEKEIASARETMRLAGVKPEDIEKTLTQMRQVSDYQAKIWAASAASAEAAYALATEKIKARLVEIQSEQKQGKLSPIQATELTGEQNIAQLKAEADLLQTQLRIAKAHFENRAGQLAVEGKITENLQKQTDAANATNQAVRAQVFETRAKAEKAYDDQRKKNNEDLAKLEAQNKQNTDAVALRVAQYGETLAANNELLKEEASLIGATSQERAVAVALMQVEITRKKQLADLAKVENLRPEFRAAKAQEIEDQATQARAQASAKIYLDAYQRVYDDISSGLADALMGGAKTAAAYIKDLFRSMVLKPIIQATLAPVTGALTNAITGGIGGGLGLGSLSGLGGLNGGITGFGFDKFATSSFGQSLGLSSLQEDAAGNTFLAQSGFANYLGGAVQSATAFAGYLDAAFAAKAGKWGTALGEGFGTYVAGPVGAFIGKLLGSAADQLFAGGAGTPHTGGYVQSDALGNFTDITARQGGIQDADAQASVKALVGPLTAVLNQTAQAFGQGAGYGLRAVFEADGKDAAEALFQVMKDGVDTVVGFEQTKNSTLASDPSKAFTQFSDQAAQAVRVALLKLDLPTWAKEQLNALGDAVSASDLANGVKAINDAQAAIVKFTSSLKPMTGLMGELGALSSDAVYALAKMSGGIDVLSGNLSTYYQAFYSDAEQSANSLALIGATLKDVGLAVPDTRESFRALVEAQDLTSESGQKAFTALLSVSGAFDKLIGSAEQAQIALDKAVETVFAKFQTPAQQSQSKYENIAGSIFGAGVGNSFESVLQAIIGASKDDIYAFAQAFLMIDSNSVAAKTAVVNAAGALFDLKDSAEKAAKAVHDTLMAAINSALTKFQSPAERQQTAYQNIATSLQSVGVGTGDPGFLGRLMGASKQQIYEFTEQFLRLSDVSDEVKTAVVNAAAGLADLKDSAATLAHETAVGDIQAQLQAISDTYGDPSVISVVEKLSDAYMRNKAEAQSLQESLDQMLGTTVQTVQQALQTMLNDQKALQNFRSNLADTIDEASLRGQTPEQRVATLRARESNLFAQLKTASDPVAVAQKLQATVLARIKEGASITQTVLDRAMASARSTYTNTIEAIGRSNLSATEKQARTTQAQLKEEAALRKALSDAGLSDALVAAELEKNSRDAQIKALEDQIGAAERLQKLSQDIAQFTGSLKFSDISPLNFQQQLEAARQLYMTTLAGAQAGDQNAQGNLVGNAKAYLDEARSYYASSGAYASIFSAVTASLDALGATGANLDPQLAALNDQLKQLQDLNNASTDLQQAVVDTSADEVAAYTAIDAAVAAREVTNQGKIDSQIQLAKDQIAAIKQTAEEQRQVLQTQSLVIGQLNAEIDRLNNNFERFLNNDELKTAIPVPAGGRV